MYYLCDSIIESLRFFHAAKWPPLIDGLVSSPASEGARLRALDQSSMRFVYVNLGMIGWDMRLILRRELPKGCELFPHADDFAWSILLTLG